MYTLKRSNIPDVTSLYTLVVDVRYPGRNLFEKIVKLDANNILPANDNYTTATVTGKRRKTIEFPRLVPTDSYA